MLRFTAHALEALERRGLSRAWVEETIARPDRREPDPIDPRVLRSFRSIEGAGGRVLRVVHRADGTDIVVITAFFDRGARP